jgi:uncharacterized membrane protein YfcA
MESYLDFTILFAAGVLAGIINILSAGGSMITLPIFIFLGLDPITANGTNRIAILIQSTSAIYSFKRQGYADPKNSAIFSLFVLPGALAGVFFSIQIDPAIFQRILAGVMILSIAFLLLPKQSPPSDGQSLYRHPILLGLGLLVIGLYGGFIQAGVGFLWLALAYRLLPISLVKINMHKVYIILIYNLPALLIFSLWGHVHWRMGLSMALGNALGAYVATHLAIKKGDRLIRATTIAMILVMALKLYRDTL